MVSKARHLASLAKTLNQNQNGEVELSTKLAPSTITPEMLNDSAGYSTGASDSAFGIMMDELINIAENR